MRISAAKGRDHHFRRLLPAFLVGALQGLAIDGDDAAFGERRPERSHELAERLIKRLGIENAKHAREGVVRGNAVLEAQNFRKKSLLGFSEFDDLDARLAPTQYRDERDEQDLDQIVTRIIGPGIGQHRERTCEELHEHPLGGSGVLLRINDSARCKR